MFLNSWSLALSLGSLMALFLLAMAARTAIRVLAFWDPGSDSNRQIRLESEIWLTSTLVKYALGFQIASLILFILAADQFCQVIVGAMCATGALLANGYGIPALLVKLLGVFLYGFWIVAHQLDISAETYPLVRFKYFYLLLVLPVLLVDATLQTLYIAGLKPDIITSCCAVVFSTTPDAGRNLLAGFQQPAVLRAFYSTMVGLVVMGGVLLRRRPLILISLFSLTWLLFLMIAMVAIITVISSYIYAMPFHNCPFCIIKAEYGYIGFALYGTLIPAAFFGISTAVIEPFKRQKALTAAAGRYQKFAVLASLILLIVFALLSSYHMLVYLITGGEV